MYESRTYDNERGEPVVVLVVTGQHDVSRFVHTMNGATPVVEQIGAGMKIVRQLKRHNFGRAALALLQAHGGTDFTDEQSPTDPAELGAWLRALPWRTILRDRNGNPCQRNPGVEHIHRAPNRDFPALFIFGDPFEITDGHEQIDQLAKFYAPFTVLALGDGAR